MHYEHTMTLSTISTKYKRSAVGLLMVGSMLSFALGQQAGHGHGHTATLNVARTHSAPIVSARASGDIGTVVPQIIRQPTSPVVLSAGTAQQSTQTGQKHGHGHGKGDSLVTLVTTSHSKGDGTHSPHNSGDGNSQNG